MDDGSIDHTRTVLQHYAHQWHDSGLRVVDICLGRHVGTATARNTGITAVHTRWVLFGDDDCVFTPHYAAGAAYLLHNLSQHDFAAAGVMLPFYYRALRPREILPMAQIGVLVPQTAQFATRFHSWPAEYLPHPPRLDERSGLIATLPVQLVGGTAILDLH